MDTIKKNLSQRYECLNLISFSYYFLVRKSLTRWAYLVPEG